MAYQHTFTVSAPIERVREFHRSATSFRAITPPFLFMSGVHAPERLEEGDNMRFTLWMGPIPVRWHVEIKRSGPWGFEDVQRSGPFESWQHTHQFESIHEGQTRVRDEIQYRLKRHWFWGPIGLLMALGLPILFRYRAWRTKSILEGHG